MFKSITICLLYAYLLTSPLTVHAQDASEKSLNIELLSQLDPEQDKEEGHNYNEVWGYTADGREYAILGAKNGVWFIDVTDPVHPTEVAFYEGPQSVWRDIKIYKNYAYVVHDAVNSDASQNGIYIYDLAGLPHSVDFVGNVLSDLKSGTSFNVYIDNGLAFLAGASMESSVVVLDLTNPRLPTVRAEFGSSPLYDLVVQNGRVFGASLQGGFVVFDVQDVESPIELARVKNFREYWTPSLWPTPDNQLLVTVDRDHENWLRFWDLQTINEPKQIAKIYYEFEARAHNLRIHDDYLYVCAYRDGLRIIDLREPSRPAEVAWYDTLEETEESRITDGVIAVYPNLPSANILVSDRFSGLYIVEFNNTAAASVEGIIREIGSQKPISNVEIDIPEISGPGRLSNSEGDFGTGYGDALSDADGRYHFTQRPGKISLSLFKLGYAPLQISDLELSSGEFLSRDFELRKLESSQVRIKVLNQLGVALSDVEVRITSEDFRFDDVLISDGRGEANRQLWYSTYLCSVREWGHHLNARLTVDSPTSAIELQTEPAYVQPFDFMGLWKSTPINSSHWVKRSVVVFGTSPGLPTLDYEANPQGKVAYAEAVQGESIMISPPFNASQFQEPTLQFQRWYVAANYLNFPDADDTLQVRISNGEDWVVIDQFTNVQDTAWQEMRYRIADYITPGSEMLVSFRLVEGDRENRTDPDRRVIVHALIDQFVVADTGFDVSTIIEPLVRSETVTSSQIFEFSPNPVGSELNIVPLLEAGSYPGNLRVTDIRGQFVEQQAMTFTSNLPVTVDLRSVAQGAYFVSLELADGRSQTVRIQVQR